MFEIIKRKPALALGLKRYFTGKACKHGHVDERTTSSGQCITCCRLLQQADRQNFPEKYKAYDRAAHARNPEKKRSYSRAYRSKNLEKVKEYVRLYHRKATIALAALRRAGIHID